MQVKYYPIGKKLLNCIECEKSINQKIKTVMLLVRDQVTFTLKLQASSLTYFGSHHPWL